MLTPAPRLPRLPGRPFWPRPQSSFMRQFVGRWEVQPSADGGSCVVTHSLSVRPAVAPPAAVAHLTSSIFAQQASLGGRRFAAGQSVALWQSCAGGLRGAGWAHLRAALCGPKVLCAQRLKLRPCLLAPPRCAQVENVLKDLQAELRRRQQAGAQ